MALMQFSAVVLLTLLTLKLLLLPRRVVVNRVVGKARRLMILGSLLLVLQFLLQYCLGLRAMGVTQAVLVNLVLFIPSSWAISLAVSYLQQQGEVNRVDKMVGGITWAIALALLGTAAAMDGQPLLSDTPELHRAEIITSGFYLSMQGHYNWRHAKNLRSMRLNLQNYYDSDMDDMLVWMKISIIVLMILALLVPLLIFVESDGLAVFGFLFFGGIFLLVDGFCGYVVSSTPKKMQEAEDNEASNKKEEACAAAVQKANSCSPVTSEIPSDPSAMIRLDHAIEKWIAAGCYLKSGITMPLAAEEIGVPRYLFSAWLKQRGLTYAHWMTDLRVEEAKRTIHAHPDWNNESVAQHCGFSDRTYFQKKFKEKTGLSPADFLASSSNR